MTIYNYLIIGALALTQYAWGNQHEISPAALHATQLFGPDGMNLGPEELQKAITVLTLLQNSSEYQQERAIEIVLVTLYKQEQALRAQESAQQKSAGPVARELYHKLFVTHERIKHVERINKELEARPTLNMLYEKVSNYVTSWWQADPAQQCAQAILAFMDMEEESILHDPKKIAEYTVMLQKYPLPPILAPWHDKEVQYLLQTRALRLGKTQVQMSKRVITLLRESSLAGMYVQGVVMFGGSVALQMSDKESAKEMTALDKQMVTMQKDLSDSFTKLQAEQKNAFTSLINTFTAKRAKLAHESEQEGKLFQQELTYLNRSIAQFALGTQLLNPDLIALDRMFEASLMQTPRGPKWYNPFYQTAYWYNEDKPEEKPVSGDWQYDGQDDRFWQQGLVKFSTQKPTDPKKALPSPSFNSIFTEYIPPSTDGYDIEVDVTVLQASYPFFAGIMFNKSRWISGNPECLSQYRLIGLYGSQEKENDLTTRSIDLCFAQQKLIIPVDPKTPSQIIGPLEQILDDKKTVVCSLKAEELTKNDVQSLVKNPQTYTIQIKTLPDSITWRLLKQKTVIKEGTISGLSYRLNPDAPQEALTEYQKKQYSLFNYHGIGYMAPGCQAAFKLTTPQALVYTQQERDAFAQELKSRKESSQ